MYVCVRVCMCVYVHVCMDATSHDEAETVEDQKVPGGGLCSWMSKRAGAEIIYLLHRVKRYMVCMRGGLDTGARIVRTGGLGIEKIGRINGLIHKQKRRSWDGACRNVHSR